MVRGAIGLVYQRIFSNKTIVLGVYRGGHPIIIVFWKGVYRGVILNNCCLQGDRGFILNMAIFNFCYRYPGPFKINSGVFHLGILAFSVVGIRALN